MRDSGVESFLVRFFKGLLALSDSSRLLKTPPGIRLCRLDAIADPGARNFVIQLRAGRFHGFVVRRADAVFGYVDRCPHLGVPLAQHLDEYLTPKREHIKCDWHGAVFDIGDGRCVAGPCFGDTLLAWPVWVVGFEVITGAQQEEERQAVLF